MSKLAGSAFLTMALAMPAHAEWRAVETRHFIVYSEDKPASVEKFVETLESYDKLMRMATGTPDDKAVKVRIYQVKTMEEVENALGERNSGIAGFYDNNSVGPFAVTPRETTGAGRYFTPDLVLHHEYAHHFMLQYFPAIYPGWYVEGFAELIGSSKMMDDGNMGYGMPALHRGHDIVAYWTPLQDLLTKDRITYLDTYGQGWAVTHYLTFDPVRSKQFRAYLIALQKGAGLADAAKQFGDLNQLNQDARKYAGAGSFPYRSVKVEIARPVIERTRAMTAGEVAAVKVAIAFRDDDLQAIRKASDRDRELKLREATLKRAREVGAQYPTDATVQYLLSEIEYSLGHMTESERAVDAALAADPDNVRAIARKSMLVSGRAKLAGATGAALVTEARGMARRANRKDPDDPMPLLAYYQSFNLVGEQPPPVAIDGLRQAVAAIPGNTGMRLTLVDQLVRDHQYREAMGWLMPLANSPHESPLREAAKERLEQIRAMMQAVSTPAKS